MDVCSQSGQRWLSSAHTSDLCQRRRWRTETPQQDTQTREYISKTPLLVNLSRLSPTMAVVFRHSLIEARMLHQISYRLKLGAYMRHFSVNHRFCAGFYFKHVPYITPEIHLNLPISG